jgi:uncharacterized membrane protein
MKKYFLAGLLVWLPIAVTLWLISWVLSSVNAIFMTIVKTIHSLIGFDISPMLKLLFGIPGFGFIFILILITLTGLLTTNIFGQWWLRGWDKLVNRIPIVKSIYSTIKQVADTLFSDKGNSFKEAVLVQYPREGIWTIAFVTGEAARSINGLDIDCISIFIPTTPNPTSGFLLLVNRKDTKPINLSVEQALKYVVSMGVLHIPAVNIAQNINQNQN